MALEPPLNASVDEVREALAPIRNDFTIALHMAENAFAVGAIIRVAHSFLAREIIIVGPGTYYEKASMGMEKYETITRVASDEELLEHIGARPLWAVEKEAATKSLYEVAAYPRDVVLLFGSERFGVPKSLIARASETIAIPIYGVNNSLPLVVAAGIVMNDWARRKVGAP